MEIIALERLQLDLLLLGMECPGRLECVARSYDDTSRSIQPNRDLVGDPNGF
jgi:hypothetical protein